MADIEKYIEDFYKEVYPEMTKLAIASNDEKSVIIDATKLIRELRESLSALDEPVCEICRGTGEIILAYDKGYGVLPYQHNPCPDCPQPPASEFTQRIKDG